MSDAAGATCCPHQLLHLHAALYSNTHVTAADNIIVKQHRVIVILTVGMLLLLPLINMSWLICIACHLSCTAQY